MTILLAVLIAGAGPGAELDTQTRQPARKAPAAPPLTRIEATLQCPSDVGQGVTTGRRFCDVLTGHEPKEGIVIPIPPHRGEVQLSFELHNRHTYSEELVREGKAFRRYTASIGVLTLDNTLVRRAAIESEFRTELDLVDRIDGGAGPGGMKAVAPTGSELITMALPTGVDEVSILGEKLTVVRPDGTDLYTSPGRPIAMISNVVLEYRPAPSPSRRPSPVPLDSKPSRATMDVRQPGRPAAVSPTAP